MLAESAEGQSLMEVIRAANTTELFGLCGGCCSCGTCHVYVDAERLDELDPMSSEEDEMLDVFESRRPNSRLSCQIAMSKALDGLRVVIAPAG